MPTEENPAAGSKLQAAGKIGWDPKSSSLPPEPEPEQAWKRQGRSLSVKLIALIFSAMVVIFALLGYANIRLHRQHLEAATLTSAERVSDVIKRSTSYHMLRNDRAAL